MNTSIQINIDVQVDLDKVGRDLEKQLAEGMRQLTMQAYEEWQSEAGRKLKTTRRRYQEAIHYVIKSDTESEISLYSQDPKTNALVNMLENGAESFNIRERMLESGKLRFRSGPISDKQRKAMFWYLKKVGRLGLPPVPFTDVPFRTKGSMEQDKPNAFRRISPNRDTKATWQHPGLKPKGQGGPGPLRPAVVEFIKQAAPKVFGAVLAKVTV